MIVYIYIYIYIYRERERERERKGKKEVLNVTSAIFEIFLMRVGPLLQKTDEKFDA